MHILSGSQFDREFLERLYAETDLLIGSKAARPRGTDDLMGKTVILLFYEPSTRTRMSFELAIKYQGGLVVGTEAAGLFSSAAKGETIEDTVQVLASYGIDAIVMRTKEEGMAARAAAVSPVPIINAGDGAGEHPTQALLDLYTILQNVRKKEIILSLCGDLENSRTVRSLCRLLVQYGEPPRFRLILCSPPMNRLGDDVRTELGIAGIPYEETDDFLGMLSRCDVLYHTRVQDERYREAANGKAVHLAIQERFTLNGINVGLMKPDAIILHPLPRVGEIAPEVDEDVRANYFPVQTRNGLYIRMALLRQILNPA